MQQLPEPIVRFSRFQFPSEENDVARYSSRARLHARRQPEGTHGHQPDNPAVDASSAQRQVPAGPGQHVQSVHWGLDQLLRPILSSAVEIDSAAYRWLPSRAFPKFESYGMPETAAF